jgi:hypothetical protein
MSEMARPRTRFIMTRDIFTRKNRKNAYTEKRALHRAFTTICTANEGPMKIQYKYLVLIYVFPEMKLLFPKQNYNVLSPSSYTLVSVRDLYISRIGLLILLQEISGRILGIFKLLTDT